MRFRTLLGLVGLLVLLQGCALQPLPQEQARNYKRIGIIPAMTDEFPTTAVGITVFGNDRKEHSLGVNFDRIFAEHLTRILSTQYTVTDLSQHGEAFAKQPKYWPESRRVIGETRQSAGEVVKRLAGQEGLDAYVVIAPGLARVGNTNQSVIGLGIVKPPVLFGKDGCFLYASYIVSVIDGKDFSVVANMKAFDAPGPGVEPGPITAPNMRVDCALWQAPEASVPAIQQALNTLLQVALPRNLGSAGLLTSGSKQ